MFSRLRCHFCGAKAPHSKTVREFQCTACEAVNYLDGRGNIVDTPAHIAAPQQQQQTKQFMSFTRAEPEALAHQKKSTFCRTCTQNQHLYNQTLAEYLPDESHPEYRQFERAIPEYKKELEKRYPLICTACAPEAQSKINRSDYYGMTENAAKLCAKTKARAGRSGVGMRDDAGKKAMRLGLNTLGLVLYAGMLLQLAFHAYGILTTLSGATSTADTAEFDITAYMSTSVEQCSQQARSLRFTSQCYHLFSDYIPHTLALAIFGLLYNPGLKAWYHHTFRIEAVNGQWNYFYMQLAILVVRCMAWWNLSDPQTLSSLDSQQTIAMHAFTIFFVFLAHTIATRGIKPVKWTMRGKIMPKPTDRDVLGVTAAPASQHYTPKASEKDPFRYLRKPNQTPFPISSLAPKLQPSQNRARPDEHRNTFLRTQQHTPEYSDREEEDDDPMELDDAAYVEQRFQQPRPNLQPSHTYYNHSNAPALAITSMREALTSVDRNMRSEATRLRDSNANKFTYNPGPTPFYGKLPPAPMSMERRLRNPPAGQEVKGRVIPMSERKDFMQLMRNGVKPVQFEARKKENFELKRSEWVLPGDVKETGLEDRFESVFTLSEVSPSEAGKGKKGFFSLFGL